MALPGEEIWINCSASRALKNFKLRRRRAPSTGIHLKSAIMERIPVTGLDEPVDSAADLAHNIKFTSSFTQQIRQVHQIVILTERGAWLCCRPGQTQGPGCETGRKSQRVHRDGKDEQTAKTAKATKDKTAATSYLYSVRSLAGLLTVAYQYWQTTLAREEKLQRKYSFGASRRMIRRFSAMRSHSPSRAPWRGELVCTLRRRRPEECGSVMRTQIRHTSDYEPTRSTLRPAFRAMLAPVAYRD